MSRAADKVEAIAGGSVFGTETKIGTGRVFKGNMEALHLSEASMSRAADKLESIAGVSGFGTETKIGTSRVYKGNMNALEQSKRSMSAVTQKANASYKQMLASQAPDHGISA